MRSMSANLGYFETSPPNAGHLDPSAIILQDPRLAPSIDSLEFESTFSINSSTIGLQEPHPTPYVHPTSDSSPSTFR
jgi:hypothetical protein